MARAAGAGAGCVRRVGAGIDDSLRGVRPPLCSAALLSLCVSLAAVPVAAWAQPEPASDAVSGPEAASRLAVLPLKIEGQADQETRERWTAGLRAGLERGDAPLVDPEALAGIEEPCARKACYDQIHARTGATHVVRATLVAKSRDFLLKLDLVDAASGGLVFSAEEVCEICGTEEVASLLDSQGALLQARLKALGSGPAVLILDSKPRGALVIVDGEVVGKTPLERPVLAGPHTIRVSLDGHVADERELTFVNGARETVSVTLHRTPGSSRSQLLGAVGLGGGLAVLAAGITLLALDDAPYRGDCIHPIVDAKKQCRSLYNTGPLGGALIGVGAIVGTLGAVALIRHRGARRSGPGRRAFVVPRGLGVAGEF